MRTIVQILFAIAGIYLAKIFWFDDVEKMAWEMFWSGDFSIKNSNDIKDILKSMTFLKSFAGFIGGSFIGIVITRMFKIK